MPLYEYQCQECGRQVELLVSSGHEPECPECGSQELAKLLSVVAAPSREAGADRAVDLPPGSCGTGCHCHPG